MPLSLDINPFTSVFKVAVPAAFSINIIRSAFVGAPSTAVVSTDCNVRSAIDCNPDEALYLITTIPEPPARPVAYVSNPYPSLQRPPPPPPPVFGVPAVGTPRELPAPELPVLDPAVPYHLHHYHLHQM